MIELFNARNVRMYENHNNAMRKIGDDTGACQWSHYHWDYPWVVESLLGKFGDLKGKKILDAGAGKGVLQFYLSKLGAEVYSLDINPYKEFVEKINPGIKFTQGNFVDSFENFPYEENFFDAIISVSVLEHLLPYNVKQASKNFGRALKKDGSLLITTNFFTHRMYTDNFLVFSKEDVKIFFENKHVELVNKEDNFEKFNQLHADFCFIMASNGFPVLPFQPRGVKLIKRGE